jgi:hypothetical protein
MIIFSTAPDESLKLMKLKQKLNILSHQIESSKNQNNNIPEQTISTRDQLRQDIENILGAECTMCGSLMIQQIDKSFKNTNEEW